jgi:uncharacterized protein
MTMEAQPLRPAPIPDELSEVYWKAAAEEKLVLQRCTVCGEHQFYPRGHCSHCFAFELEWVTASGHGVLHTYSVVYRTASSVFQGRVPYVFAIAELEEGPRLTVNVIDTPLEDLRCDMPVEVVFDHETDDFVLPCVRSRSL